MNPFGHNSITAVDRRLLTVAAVVCACVWLAPRCADASCGDYVIVTGQSKEHGPMEPHVRSPQKGKPIGFPVCNSPSCRQRGANPAAPLTRITLDEHSWGLPLSLVSLIPEASVFGDFSVELTIATWVAAGIFRPPRIGFDLRNQCARVLPRF